MTPVRMRSRVVLPQPLGPSRPTRSPVSTWKVSPSKILCPTSNSFTRLETEMSIIVSSSRYFSAISIVVRPVEGTDFCHDPILHGLQRHIAQWDRVLKVINRRVGRIVKP